MPKHFVNNSKTSFWSPENDFFDPKIAKNDPSNRSKVVKFWLKILIFESIIDLLSWKVTLIRGRKFEKCNIFSKIDQFVSPARGRKVEKNQYIQ